MSAMADVNGFGRIIRRTQLTSSRTQKYKAISERAHKVVYDTSAIKLKGEGANFVNFQNL